MKKLFKISACSLSLSVMLKGQFSFLNHYYEVTAIASPGIGHEDIKKNEGIKTCEILIKRRINILYDLKSLFLLYRLFRKEKPYIVHSVTPKAGLLSVLAGYLAGVPHRIHTFTGLIFPYRTGFMYHLLKNMDRLICLFATKVIPEGLGVKNDLIGHRVTYKELKIIGNGNVNGIDVEHFKISEKIKEQRFELRNNWFANENTVIFCFVGRIVGDKGINELVKAYYRVREIQKNVRLLLVGSREDQFDPLQNETKQMINTDESIIEPGFIKDIRPYLAASDVFVLPSYREGFPNVVLQAGAMELPSIVTDISGCNEIIINGKNGVIIPSKDEESLYLRMLELTENSEKRKILSTAARQMIIERYEQKYFWNELLNEYKLLN